MHLSFLTSLLSFIFLLLFFSFLQRLVSLFLFTALSPLSSWLSLTLHNSLHLFSALSALFCLLFLRFLFWSEMAHRDVCHVLLCVCCGLVVRVFVVKLVCVCVCVCAGLAPFGMKWDEKKSFSHVTVCCWNERSGVCGVWCGECVYVQCSAVLCCGVSCRVASCLLCCCWSVDIAVSLVW